MKLTGDYHTHTIYSHGKGTILDNALSAKSAGLSELAITDHGFEHKLYNVERNKVCEIKQNIEQAEKQTGLKIYFGLEANFTSVDGDIDLTAQELANLDILLVGHHRFVKRKFKDQWKMFLPNLIFPKLWGKRLRKRNTNLIIKAMDKYPIDILVHLKHGMPIDVEAVAKKAVETKTYIELNASKLLFSETELALMVKLGVMFVVNTDAHRPEKVGQVQNVFDFISAHNIPENNIANINGKTLILKNKQITSKV